MERLEYGSVMVKRHLAVENLDISGLIIDTDALIRYLDWKWKTYLDGVLGKISQSSSHLNDRNNPTILL